MRFQGFIGPSYVLDSVNVDCQRCVNLYLEKIESGTGKGGQGAYLRATPGLTKILDVGDGPIRLIHVDSIGRIFVVSNNKIYRVAKRADWVFKIAPVSATEQWLDQSTDVNTGTEEFTIASHGYYNGLKVRVSSDGTLPTGLSDATDYWVTGVTTDTFKLASTIANANAETAIDITGAGTGIMTVTPQIPSALLDVNVDDDVNVTTNVITRASHNLFDGLKIRLSSVFVPLPGGLSLATDYYVIKVDANTFKLATSLANAVAGTAVDITDATAGDWAATTVKTLATGTTEVTLDTTSGVVKAASMSWLGDGEDSSTIFVDGTNNYLFQDSGSGVITCGDLDAFGFGDVLTATDITWIDGSFIVNEGGTNKFWVSDLQSFNFDALTFSSSEGDPDLIVALIENHRDLWIFNEKTTEVYADTGNADFPFERIAGGFIEIGCAAAGSVAKIEGTIFWLGRSKEGRGIVYAVKGLQPQRISTHAIEQAISGYADITTAVAYTYQKNGHSFYVLNFDEATWVYDMTTGLWHERGYTSNGDIVRHRGQTHAYHGGYDVHLVGDWENNNLYIFDDEVYYDDTTEITRLRTFPHLSGEGNLLYCSKFQLDMETGVGLDGGVQGSDPQVMLDWSNDGGHTWSDESWTSAGGQVGGIGDYKKRVIWRRLGKFRDRVFRVKITDPVKVVLIDAFIDVTPGAS